MNDQTLPARPPLAVGDLVRLRDYRERYWWKVAAVSENFAALTRQAPFEHRGTLEYTVLDWRNAVRGPCNLVGQGYGDGSYTAAQCAAMLDEFEERRDGGFAELEVSHRNRVPLHILAVAPVIMPTTS